LKNSFLKSNWIILLSGIMLCSLPVHATEKNNSQLLVFATHSPDSTPHLQWATALYRKALAQLGYRLNIRRCEPHLCTRLANNGQVDGELLRVAIYQAEVPYLIRVQQPMLTMTWAAFTLKEHANINSWEEIIKSDLRISFLPDIPYLSHHLVGKVPKWRLIKMKHWISGPENLISGNADVYITADSVITTGPVNSGLRRVVLSKDVPMFAYLHKKHKQLALDLPSVIVNMRKKGEIDAIYQQITAADPQ